MWKFKACRLSKINQRCLKQSEMVCPMCMNTQGCIQEDRTRPRPKSTRQRSQGPANRQNEGESCKEDKDDTANLKRKLKTNKNNISMAHINI